MGDFQKEFQAWNLKNWDPAASDKFYSEINRDG
jgi:hypothetical protein